MELVNQLVNTLSSMPQRIEEAERNVMNALNKLNEAESALASKEASLLLQGKITGKNEMERKAQLLTLTAEEREAVRQAQQQLNQARVEYNRALNEFKAARSIALVIGQASSSSDA